MIVRVVADADLTGTVEALLAAADRQVVAPSEWRSRDQVVRIDAREPRRVREAVTAALRGGSLVATVSPTTRPALVTDLGDLGPVEVWTSGAPDLPAAGRLSADQVGVLAALAWGASTAEAAATVHLSPRSAERRLRDARVALGVQTVAEAVVELSRTVARWR